MFIFIRCLLNNFRMSAGEDICNDLRGTVYVLFLKKVSSYKVTLLLSKKVRCFCLNCVPTWKSLVMSMYSSKLS